VSPFWLDDHKTTISTHRHPVRGAARSDAPQTRDLIAQPLKPPQIPDQQRGTGHRNASGMTPEGGRWILP